MSQGLRDIGDDAAHVATALGSDLKQRVDELSATTTRQARRAMAIASEQVRENPAAALGVAAGLGLIVGMLMARR